MRSAKYGYWIKFDLLIETEKNVYILIPHYGTDIIRFYQISNKEIVNEQKAGVNIKEADKLIQKIVKKTKPGDLILLHDTEKSTLDALESIIIQQFLLIL